MKFSISAPCLHLEFCITAPAGCCRWQNSLWKSESWKGRQEGTLLSFPTSHLANENFLSQYPAIPLEGMLRWLQKLLGSGTEASIPTFYRMLTWSQQTTSACSADKAANSSRTKPCVRDRWQRRLWWTQPHPFVLWNCVMRMEEAWKLPRISNRGLDAKSKNWIHHPSVQVQRAPEELVHTGKKEI